MCLFFFRAHSGFLVCIQGAAVGHFLWKGDRCPLGQILWSEAAAEGKRSRMYAKGNALTNTHTCALRNIVDATLPLNSCRHGMKRSLCLTVRQTLRAR